MAVVTKNQDSLIEGQSYLAKALQIGLAKVSAFGGNLLVYGLTNLPVTILLILLHLILIHFLSWWNRR